MLQRRMVTYTHRLSRHEMAMIRHVNPDMRAWWLPRFCERLGADEVRALDPAETALVQGVIQADGESW